MTLSHPDVFVAGAIGGHRLRHVGDDVLWNELIRILDVVLDSDWHPDIRQRAGEYMLGFAAGWESHP